MIWFHLLHNFLWGRPGIAINATLDFWKASAAESVKTARSQGYDGARWPKMTGPVKDMLLHDGPSGVGPLLVWEQPHPVIFAELAYRAVAKDDDADTAMGRQSVLEEWNSTVHLTATFMASFVLQSQGYGSCLAVGPPVCGSEIECGEAFANKSVPPELQTKNPTFETTYFRFALTLAQRWRSRLGLANNTMWAAALAGLCVPKPKRHNGADVYWPQENSPNFLAGSSIAQLYAVSYANSVFLSVSVLFVRPSAPWMYARLVLVLALSLDMYLPGLLALSLKWLAPCGIYGEGWS